MELKIKTKKREEIVDITIQIENLVKKSKLKEGLCLVYVPHATAAITINENYDPAVCEDFLEALRKIAPKGIWKHDKIDGNGDAHIKAAIIGPSEVIPIKNSKLALGRWQGIMFCEFDGPRERRIIINLK
ncbi:MAG: YjbQ family protein [Candidatus Pacearchaeota archaeon]|nr:MAG: YjbQ family protein [Candidatus Pacearchaeota archaeon]